jgi:putative MFS transporter
MTTILSAEAAPAALDERGDPRSAIICRIERLPFSRFHMHLASILAVGTFFDAFDAISIAVALPVIFSSLHIGFMNAGLLISGAYVGQFVGAWFFGWVSEIWGRKIAFVTSLLLFGLLSIGTAFAWNFESLFVLRLIQGLGLGGEVPVAATLFNEYLRTANRGRISLFYQSIFIWGGLLTPGIGLLLFSIFGEALGWRILFLFGGLPVVAAIYAWFRLPESARWLAERGRFREAEAIIAGIEAEARAKALPPLVVTPQPAPGKTRIAELFQGIYLKRTIVVWVQWACTFFVAYGYNIWLPTLYVKIGGLPLTQSLILSSISWALTLGTMYVEAMLLDKIGRKPFFVFGFAAIALGGLFGAIMIMVFHATGWPILFAVAVFMGIGTSLNSSAALNYTAELYPTRMRGIGVASASSMSRLASILSPTVVGALLAAGFGIESVFAMFGAAGLIGFVVMAMMGVETKQRMLEELSP